MQQIAAGFKSCINGLNALCLTILGRSKRINIVYGLATFFKKALDNLHEVCTRQAEDEDQTTTGGEYAVNKYLCGALVSIAQTDWTVGNPGHSDILEGILFSILDHTGRLVSNAVFNEHVAISERAGNISIGGLKTPTKCASLEARYFIPILIVALGESSSRRDLISRILCDSSSYPNNQSQCAISSLRTNPEHELLTKARKRLQETLIKCAVGGEEFDSLKLPTQPESLGDMFESGLDVEKYSPEWLLESVWATVGWELAI